MVCDMFGIFYVDNNADDRCIFVGNQRRLESEPDAANIDLVVFCTFLDSDLQLYRRFLPLAFPRVDRQKPIAGKSGEETKQASAESETDNTDDTPVSDRKSTRLNSSH